MDSRPGQGAPDNHGERPLAPGEIFQVQVTGVAAEGIAVPATAVGIFGNLTVTGFKAPGYAQLFPANLPSTRTSAVNFSVGQTVANAFTIALSPTGAIKLAVFGGATDVIIDITGYLDAIPPPVTTTRPPTTTLPPTTTTTG
jgi:hypothetical protein